MRTSPAGPGTDALDLTWLDRLLQRWRQAKARPFIAAQSRMLDIGCGDGSLFQRLASAGVTGIGIDPALSGVVELPNARLLPGRFPDDLPRPDAFDVIVGLAVVEHVPEADLRVFADHCGALLNPGGRLVLTVPAPVVDPLLRVLRGLRLVRGMALAEHHGFRPEDTVPLFVSAGLTLRVHRQFQLGCNHLFVFERAPA